VSFLLVACAAQRKASEPATPAAEPAAAGGQHADQMAPPSAQQPAQPGYAPAPPPPSEPRDHAPAPTRALALSQAGNEVESSQRELDVAGGDCRNACRALGSMDRAAGRLCGLAQSEDEQRRCGDAKTRVYSARDKVRNTCGTCPDVTVERGAPIPSR
jgi:hypothetical protein